MQFKLMNAPVSFQKLMDEVVKALPFLKLYPNDIVVFSKSLEEHMEHSKVELKQISSFKIKLELLECCFKK